MYLFGVELKDLVISSSIQGYGFADSQELGKVFNKKWFIPAQIEQSTSHTEVYERNLSKY